MRFTKILGSMTVLALGLCGTVYASNYYPPERMHCRLNNIGKLSCGEFNREYLTEDTFNADFPPGSDVTFHFASAVAYLAPSLEEASVYFTFNDSKTKMVKLKTTSTAIRPDLDPQKGSWQKFKDDIYVCTAGYMSCPITNLPSNSK